MHLHGTMSFFFVVKSDYVQCGNQTQPVDMYIYLFIYIVLIPLQDDDFCPLDIYTVDKKCCQAQLFNFEIRFLKRDFVCTPKISLVLLRTDLKLLKNTFLLFFFKFYLIFTILSPASFGSPTKCEKLVFVQYIAHS